MHFECFLTIVYNIFTDTLAQHDCFKLFFSLKYKALQILRANIKSLVFPRHSNLQSIKEPTCIFFMFSSPLFSFQILRKRKQFHWKLLKHNLFFPLNYHWLSFVFASGTPHASSCISGMFYSYLFYIYSTASINRVSINR